MIVRFLKSFMVRVRLALEILKGVATVQEVERSGELIGTLTGYTTSGFSISIKCEKKTFYRKTTGFIQSHSEHNVYFVYSEVSDDAPASLKEACNFMSPIPQLLHESLSDLEHGKASINAFLDMLVKRMERAGHQFNA